MAEQAERIEAVGAGDYKRFDQKNDFALDKGLVVLPIARRTSGHRVIRLHGGYAKRTVRWAASRTGRPPLIPAANDTTGDTLLSASFVPSLPTPNPDGPGYDWSCRGEYVYVQGTARVPGENAFPVGQYPFLHAAAAEAAEALGSQYVQSSYVSGGFEPFIEQMATITRIDGDGLWIWPFLAMPSAFSSTHLIGG